MVEIDRKKLIPLSDAVREVYERLLEQDTGRRGILLADPMAPKMDQERSNDLQGAAEPAIRSSNNNAPKHQGAWNSHQTEPEDDELSRFPVIDRKIYKKAEEALRHAILQVHLTLICEQVDEASGTIVAYRPVQDLGSDWNLARVLGGFGFTGDFPPSLPRLARSKLFVEKDPFSTWRKNRYPTIGSNRNWPISVETTAIEALAGILKEHCDIAKEAAFQELKRNFPSLPRKAFEKRIWPDARIEAGLPKRASPGRKRKSLRKSPPQ